MVKEYHWCYVTGLSVGVMNLSVVGKAKGRRKIKVHNIRDGDHSAAIT